MGLETGSTISALVSANPLATDPRSEGDDHIRLIKSVLKAQFPGSGGGFSIPISATEAEINRLTGVTANVQTQINAIYQFPVGTKAVFVQASAPTGWTIDTGFNDRMLYVNSASGGTTGGSSNPLLNNVVPSHTHNINIDSGNESLTHTHNIESYAPGAGAESGFVYTQTGGNRLNFNALVESVLHIHNVTGVSATNTGAANWTPKYATCIVASKN